jgi:coenzyme PQQ precursor peptide PqqA
MAWTTPTLVEICIGLEINGYLPAEFWSATQSFTIPVKSAPIIVLSAAAGSRFAGKPCAQASLAVSANGERSISWPARADAGRGVYSCLPTRAAVRSQPLTGVEVARLIT